MARESNEIKQRREYIKERFDLITTFLNEMEKELLVEKTDRAVDLEKISILYGKIAVNFTVVAKELKIYEGKEGKVEHK